MSVFRAGYYFFLLLFLTACADVMECDRDKWGGVEFSRSAWANSADRTVFYPSIQRLFIGKDAHWVKDQIGEPYRKSKDGSWIYVLGDISFFGASCVIETKALLWISFDENGNVADVLGYVD